MWIRIFRLDQDPVLENIFEYFNLQNNISKCWKSKILDTVIRLIRIRIFFFFIKSKIKWNGQKDVVIGLTVTYNNIFTFGNPVPEERNCCRIDDLPDPLSPSTTTLLLQGPVLQWILLMSSLPAQYAQNVAILFDYLILKEYN